MPTSLFITSSLATSYFRAVSCHHVGTKRWLLRRSQNLLLMACRSVQTETLSTSWMMHPSCRTFSTSIGTAGSSSQQQKEQIRRQSAADPMAKRPTFKCDPYGQGGKPLSQPEAASLLATVDDKWVLEYDDGHMLDSNDETQATPTTPPPYALTREFSHPDYLSATRFLHKMSAVAQVQDHFPFSLTVERRIVRKQWQVVSKIVCRTTVLEGLSQHDFHLAMMMDVEIARPDVQVLLLQKDDE